jgi:polyhydroxyalkanoate synthesis repressor PhaR
MYLSCVRSSMGTSKMKPAPVLIRKYGNRRLYDSSNSEYVNLDDIARFIREGRDVQVVDAKTGRDLTRVTLTQIITEDAKDKPTGLPLELLRQLVVASDEVRQEFVMWYLKSAFDTYQKVQDTVVPGRARAGGGAAPSRGRAGTQRSAPASSGTGSPAEKTGARKTRLTPEAKGKGIIRKG